ncbi:hypothetical protein G7043_30185 [Lentzea sp. NEAU-D13]|uniref:Uncharacterized protein n=1 Tax=Lentzea alba TaxID=2714351 RepID=A0A7C9W266_9PSEU|nr:hypothetical protein [Lentzea alba]NGY63197.1 hypothetical protein [Lentzea alba]
MGDVDDLELPGEDCSSRALFLLVRLVIRNSVMAVTIIDLPDTGQSPR